MTSGFFRCAGSATLPLFNLGGSRMQMEKLIDPHPDPFPE